MSTTSSTVLVHITRVREGFDDLALPAYETPGAAGMDLRAAVDGDVVLSENGGTAKVPTGLAIALPDGFEAQVRPRSGLAAKHAVTVLNAPGTIDSDYRGEVQVLLINHGVAPFTVRRGDRIAQLVVAPITRAAWSLARQLPTSERGEGGFGSTG